MHGIGRNAEDQVTDSTEIIKETLSDEHQRRQDLALEIPSSALVSNTDDQLTSSATPSAPYMAGGAVTEMSYVIDTVRLRVEEEGACRICLVEVGEDSQALRMECKCKGGLALAHHECALKWFGIKGNKTCDICKHEVQNLPLTLQAPGGVQAQHQEVDRFNMVGELAFYVAIAKSLAYFCLLEPLAVKESGFIATPIVLIGSVLLGLFGSIVGSTVVWNKYLWVYTAAQFMCEVPCSLLMIKLQSPISLAVAFPASVGWGISLCCALILDEIAKRRRRKLKGSNQHHGSVEEPNHLHASSAVQIETSTGPTNEDIV